jgi:superfamily II DNA or RNA helicase
VVVEVKLDSRIWISNCDVEILGQIKKELTMDNPGYSKKLRMGIPVWGEPKVISLWEEEWTEKKKWIVLPRGYYARLYTILYENKADVDTQDDRLRLPLISFPGYPILRDYQEPAIPQAMNWTEGCLIMPCGSGKTETGMAIAASIRQSTLWITHTRDLLKQSMDRAIERLKLTGDMVGLIQGENMKIGSHMTFATVQTLAKRDLTEIKNKFGCVIIDEAHSVFKDAAKARMFESVISQFPAYYRFGLTASEHRADGLINTMFQIIGPKVYEVDQDDPRLKTMTPRVEFIETDFDFHMDSDIVYNEQTGEMEEKEKMLNVQQLYQSMRESCVRNGIIIRVLAQHKPGDATIILGHSLNHLEELMETIKDLSSGRYECRFISGETKKKDREAAISDMREGRAQFLFATYSLAKLGLDIPLLNRLVLATPVKDKTSVQQAVGRIMRPFEGKETPVVYDIWDKNIKQMRLWARERVKMYRNLGCQIEGGPKIRKEK